MMMPVKSKSILFKVIRNGRVLMSTEHEACIYPDETLLSMQAAGYKFRLNGKAWKPSKLEQNQLYESKSCVTRKRKKLEL